jgi:hypothetical protein
MGGLNPSIWFAGWIGSNPLTIFLFDGWIGWINYWMDWMDMSLMDFIATPISNPYSQDVKLYKDEAYVRDINKTKKSHILHL